MKILNFIPFFLAISGYFLASIYFKAQEFKAPNLIGLNIYNAIQKSREYNINLSLLDEEENNDLPSETIIEQKPRSNTLIKERQTIYIVTTKKKSNPELIDFKNKDKEEINKWLNKNSLKANFHYLPSLNISDTKCIGQHPGANKINYDKKNLIIYLAKNNKKYILPSFVNKNCLDVINFLKLNGIKYKTDKKIRNKSIVLEQKPLAKSIIEINDNLEISLQIS